MGDGGVRLWIAEGRNGGRARAERSLMGAQPTGEPAMMLGLMSDELRQGEGTEGGAAQHVWHRPLRQSVQPLINRVAEECAGGER